LQVIIKLLRCDIEYSGKYLLTNTAEKAVFKA
jgi:hypothetical protein